MTWTPHDPEAEAGLIGVCLLAPSLVGRLCMELNVRPEDFYTPVTRKLWETMVGLHDEDRSIDEVTVAAALNDPKSVEQVQDMIASASPTGAIRDHVQILKNMSQRRSWLAVGTAYVDAATTGDEARVAQAEKIAAAPTVSEDTVAPKQIGEGVVEFLSAKGAVGVTTGFTDLDERIGGGFRPGDATALGAWTSMGKSAWLNGVLCNASTEGKRVHLYINEMSVTDVALRQIALRSGVDYGKLAVRDLTVEEQQLARDAASRLPFSITECSQWSADRIARHIRANRWDICALDLLHNMPYDGENELRAITTTLCAAARSAGTHLILVCQFNEARAIQELLPRPTLRDIRGSGMIKNLCANVLLLHREQKLDAGIVFTQLDAAVIIAKARHGQRGAVRQRFAPERMRFVTPSYERSV